MPSGRADGTREQPPQLQTFLSWQEVDSAALTGRTVVVIDVLRWTTVVVTALANGALRVEAEETPDSAMRRAHELGRAHTLLGGERENVALPGFDAGNSPAEYGPDRVAGRIVVTTTTNGTQALRRARAADQVIIAAFPNLDAVAAVLRARLEVTGITFLCAGRSGAEAAEDTACAGALADLLDATHPGLPRDVATERAVAAWRGHGKRASRAVGASPHAAVLRADGFAADVTAACEQSAVSIVPMARGAVITAAPGI